MKAMRVFLIVLLVGAALVLFELYRSNSGIDVERITVRRGDLPEGFDGFRIAHVSDLHGNSFGIDNDELCAMIHAERVDIIVLTGDYVNSMGDVSMVYATAVKLCEVAPVYYVPGNHEYDRRYDVSYKDVERDLVRAGVTVLRNRAVELERGGDTVTLLGVDDPNGNADMLSMAETVALAKERSPEFLIMLNHRYDREYEAAALGVDIMFAGHAHGGLIRVPFTDGLVGPSRVLFPQHTNGLYDIDGMSLVVSRGLGNAKPSMRMFNRFHLPIVTLEQGS